MKLKRKTNINLLKVFGLTAFLFAFAAGGAKALEPGKVILDKDFGPDAVDYLLKSQPVISGPFTGAQLKDLKEILPYYANPLTKYSISVVPTDGKQSYSSGGSVSVKGKINYTFDSKEAQKDLSELKDCKVCASQDVYRFPQLSGVGVFAQIWRKDVDQAQSQKGDYLIDEFYAAQGLTLKENQPQDFQLKWDIPSGLESGDYYIFFFLNSNKRFALAGSPLTPFNQAAVYNFTVKNNEEASGVELDKNNIKINDKSYVYRQPAPTIEPDNGKITISLPLSNLGSNLENAKITYNLFNWGQEDPVDIVSTKQENKSLNTKDKTNLEYAFDVGETGSVYNLEIKAETGDSVSTADIRFVVKGIDRGMVRFLGQAQNKEGKFFPVFCLRNATWDSMFHGKVNVTAWSQKGDNLRSFEKEGQIRPEDHCFVITDEAWLANGNVAKLTAIVFNDQGTKIDEKSVELISQEKSASESTQSVLGSMINSKFKIILITLAIILLIIGGYIILRNKKQI